MINSHLLPTSHIWATTKRAGEIESLHSVSTRIRHATKVSRVGLACQSSTNQCSVGKGDRCCQLPHNLQRMPYLLDIDMDIFQSRSDASMPQQILNNVKVALGLLHQISCDGVSKTVRAYVNSELTTQGRVET